MLRATFIFGAYAAMAMPLSAQEPGSDSARSVVDTSGPRPERQPPISPRRAFLYSLVAPGYAQSILGRNRGGAFFAAFEAAAFVMVRISAADIREARRNLADSVPVSFVDANGAPAITYAHTPFSSGLLRSRRAHLEDWLAVLFANHLFAGADAYVAALLWDLPAEISVGGAPQGSGRGARLSLRFSW